MINMLAPIHLQRKILSLMKMCITKSCVIFPLELIKTPVELALQYLHEDFKIFCGASLSHTTTRCPPP